MARLSYQYETSPRKIQPEYNPNKTKKQRNTSTKVSDSNKKITKVQEQKKNQARNIALIAGMFFVLLVVSYRNSLINEKFKEIQGMKSELSSIQKTNEQLKVSLEGNLNLENIEQEAKEKLNLQKLDNSQKVYISLPKKDYTEVATEEINIEKNKTNIFERIIKNIFGE